MLAVAGVATVLVAVPALFRALQLLGGAYVLYLRVIPYWDATRSVPAWGYRRWMRRFLRGRLLRRGPCAADSRVGSHSGWAGTGRGCFVEQGPAGRGHPDRGLPRGCGPCWGGHRAAVDSTGLLAALARTRSVWRGPGRCPGPRCWGRQGR
jgi:hypothetical protein